MRINVSGIEIELKIKGYEPSKGKEWDDKWCQCDFSFRSGAWLNYSKEDDEVLLSNEVEFLEESLSKLLNNELKDTLEIKCVEPDYIFLLQPKRDRRKDPRYTYIKPGYEIADIYLEWKVFFWNDGLTDNYLCLRLDREQITVFRDYLRLVKNEAVK